MKKAILAVVAGLMVATSAMAGEYMGVTAGTVKNTVSEQRANYGIVTYGQTLGTGLSVEGRAGLSRTLAPITNSNFGEARLRYETTVMGFKPWVRGTLGEQLNEGNGHYSYWAVEPGVGYQITSKLRGDLSVMRQEAFNRGLNINQSSWIVGATYALTPKNALTARFVNSYDNVKSNAVEVGYVRSF